MLLSDRDNCFKLHVLAHTQPSTRPPTQKTTGISFFGFSVESSSEKHYKMNKTTNQTGDIRNLQKIIIRACNLGLTARVTNNLKLNKSTNFKLEIQ